MMSMMMYLEKGRRGVMNVVFGPHGGVLDKLALVSLWVFSFVVLSSLIMVFPVVTIAGFVICFDALIKLGALATQKANHVFYRVASGVLFYNLGQYVVVPTLVVGLGVLVLFSRRGKFAGIMSVVICSACVTAQYWLPYWSSWCPPVYFSLVCVHFVRPPWSRGHISAVNSAKFYPNE